MEKTLWILVGIVIAVVVVLILSVILQSQGTGFENIITDQVGKALYPGE